MLKDARKKTGLSLEAAAQRAFSDPKTLSRYENGHSFPPPERVLLLAEIYDQPDLPHRYCSQMCPIGRILWPGAMDKDIAAVVLSLLISLEQARSKMDRLVEMACTGNIPENEAEQFKDILESFLVLEQAIENLKLWAAKEKLYVAPKEKVAFVKEESTCQYNFNGPNEKELNYVWPWPDQPVPEKPIQPC
ncbi:hypothetical protein JCM14036_30400 [Desulfotomaculum defluvii]